MKLLLVALLCAISYAQTDVKGGIILPGSCEGAISAMSHIPFFESKVIENADVISAREMPGQDWEGGWCELCYNSQYTADMGYDGICGVEKIKSDKCQEIIDYMPEKTRYLGSSDYIFDSDHPYVVDNDLYSCKLVYSKGSTEQADEVNIYTYEDIPEQRCYGLEIESGEVVDYCDFALGLGQFHGGALLRSGRNLVSIFRAGTKIKFLKFATGNVYYFITAPSGEHDEEELEKAYAKNYGEGTEYFEMTFDKDVYMTSHDLPESHANQARLVPMSSPFDGQSRTVAQMIQYCPGSSGVEEGGCYFKAIDEEDCSSVEEEALVSCSEVQTRPGSICVADKEFDEQPITGYDVKNCGELSIFRRVCEFGTGDRDCKGDYEEGSELDCPSMLPKCIKESADSTGVCRSQAEADSLVDDAAQVPQEAEKRTSKSETVLIIGLVILFLTVGLVGAFYGRNECLVWQFRNKYEIKDECENEI